MHKYQRFSLASAANSSGVPFVHLQMGDAKDRSPQNSKYDMDLEMGDAKECSPCCYCRFRSLKALYKPTMTTVRPKMKKTVKSF